MLPTLDARLSAAAELVRPGQPVADIGCDHGKLTAVLAASGKYPKVIGADLRPGPLAKAAQTLEYAGCKDRAELRLGDGLSVLSPGEAGTIMHKLDNIGEVELATMTFGQSFQITPVQLAVMASSVVNGGRRITPHFGVAVQDQEGKILKEFSYPVKKGIVTEKVSEQMREILEKVVAEGSGKKAYLEGYRIGGKTATSQTLPRSAHKYISSFPDIPLQEEVRRSYYNHLQSYRYTRQMPLGFHRLLPCPSALLSQYIP